MNRRHLHALLLMSVSAGLGVRAEVAPTTALPTASLRVAINYGNAVLAQIDSQSGRLSGVSVDIARELGRRLGVTVELLGFDAANKSVEAVREGVADFGFFAVDPQRSKGLRFTEPYLIIEGAYAVAQSSAIQSLADVDRPGNRVVVANKSAYDLYLSRTLEHAELVKTTRSDEVVDRMLAQHLEVAAGVKQQLEKDLQTHTGLRLLRPSFMQIKQAMATAESNTALHAYLQRFIQNIKFSGFVRTTLQRHHIEGVDIAP